MTAFTLPVAQRAEALRTTLAIEQFDVDECISELRGDGIDCGLAIEASSRLSWSIRLLEEWMTAHGAFTRSESYDYSGCRYCGSEDVGRLADSDRGVCRDCVPF